MANITTDPVPNGTPNGAQYAMSGKMEYLVDGLNYCEDGNNQKKSANMDCFYDVRLMSNHGDIMVCFLYLILQIRNLTFNVLGKFGNIYDTLSLYLKVQLRYQSDLDNEKPSSTIAPFACMRLCNSAVSEQSRTGGSSDTRLKINRCSSE